MEVIEKNHRFGEFGAQMIDDERCLCCEAAFGCRVELFGHLKTKHWARVFHVLMMGPGSDPVERWIDGILNNKCKYDGTDISNKEGTLPICSGREQAESSGMLDLSVSYYDLVSPDESPKLEKSDKDQRSESFSFHSFVFEGDGDMSNAAQTDFEAVICLQKVPQEKHFISRAPVSDIGDAAANEKMTPPELQQHREAVVDSTEESASSAEAIIDCCRLCGEIAEERLPHVLQAHLKAKIFQCRQCGFVSHSRPKDVFDHISAEHPGNLGSLDLFCNRLDEHRVGIDQLLLHCFGIDDPVELTAVMCGSSIRGYLDGLEFFRRAVQVDHVARQTSVNATEATVSDALNKPQPDQVSEIDNNAATADSPEDQEPSLIIDDDDPEQQAAATVAQMDDDDDSSAEVIFAGVVDTARSAMSTISDSPLRQVSVRELRNDFRNIDASDGPVMIAEEPTDSLPPLHRRVANNLNLPSSLDAPTVCLNLEAEAVEDDDLKADASVISITVPAAESPPISAQDGSKNQIARIRPNRRSARMTPSSAQQQPTVTLLEQIPDGDTGRRSLRQTPGRQALAAEQRTLLAAAQMTSQTVHESPPKRQAIKRSSTDPRDRSNGKSRRSRTPPLITPSKERLQTLRSRPPSAAAKSTTSTSTAAAATSAPGRTELTPETSPTVSRKSLRVSAGEPSNRVDAHSVEKSTVVESQPDASTSKRQLRRSAASPTTDKHQSTSPVETAATPGSTKEVTCKECGAVLKFRERRRHVLRQHVRLPLFECPVVDCSFSSFTNYSHCREHISNVHKLSPVEAIDNRSKYQQQIDEWMRKCL